jgi:chitinase
MIMATIDFTKVPVKNVKGQTEVKNYRDYIAEQLYNQSHDEAGAMLAQKIAQSTGETELSEDECNILKTLLAPYPYFMRSAFDELLK